MTLLSLVSFTALIVLGQENKVGSFSIIHRECIYVSPRKYIGYYLYKSGSANIVPFLANIEIDKDRCNAKCMYNDKCFATSIDHRLICSFYNTSDFIVRQNGKVRYSLWKPCDMNKGDQPPDGRCKGLWLTFLEKWISVDSYGILGVMRMQNDLSRSRCRERCLNNRLCGFININESHCIFIPKWPAEEITYKKTLDSQSKMDTWICANYFVETFNITTNVKKPIDEKCTGYWLLTDRYSSLSCPNDIGILFHTQVYSECLAECEQHPTCFRVYFNFTYSVCVLDCIQTSDHALHPANMTFMEFKWVCTRDDARKPPLNAEEQRLEKLGMKCSKIIRNSDLFIALDRCGTCPSGNEFTKCYGKFHHDSKWKIKDSCRVNQSFWAFPSQRIQLNITGYGAMNVARVFTGLAQYCLAYLDADNLISADYLECRIFNASRATYKLDPKEIVSQEDWQHQPPIGKIYPFPHTPTKVVISASQQPLHSCRTKAAGIDLMRWLQVIMFRGDGRHKPYFDLTNSFYVDQNGNIYEGRGWRLQSASVGVFNEETIAIGFIGWFRTELPTERFLNSVKRLIEFGVDNNYIAKEYSLYIHQDLGKARVRRNLVFVIRNWYRYKGFIPNVCSHMSNSIILFNVLAALFCVFLFLAFYKLCFFVVSCKKCRFLSRNCWTFKKVFPLTSSLWYQNAMLTLPDRFHTVYIVYEKSPESSKKAHYYQVLDLLKTSSCNIILNTFSSRCNGYDLNTNLSNTCVKHVDCEVHEAEFKTTYGAVSNNEKVILCVSSIGGGVFLKNLIRGQLCICMYYKVERFDAKELTKEIDD